MKKKMKLFLATLAIFMTIQVSAKTAENSISEKKNNGSIERSSDWEKRKLRKMKKLRRMGIRAGHLKRHGGCMN
jgi:hypothetical protein